MARYPARRARPQRPSFSSLSRETPVLPQKAASVGDLGTGSKCGQFFVTAVNAGDAFMVSQGDGVAALGAGATANLVCFSWLARHNCFLERHGIPRATTIPSQARFRSGGGRLGGCAMQQIFQWGSQGIRESSLRVSLKGTLQRFRAMAPRRFLATNGFFARLAEFIPTGSTDTAEGEYPECGRLIS